MKEHLGDTCGIAGKWTLAKGIADFKHGLPERRRDTVFHAAGRSAKAGKLATFPHPIGS